MDNNQSNPVITTWLSLIKDSVEGPQELQINLTGNHRLMLRVTLFEGATVGLWETLLSGKHCSVVSSTLPECAIKMLEWTGEDFTVEDMQTILTLDNALYFYCPPDRVYVKNETMIYSFQWLPIKK